MNPDLIRLGTVLLHALWEVALLGLGAALTLRLLHHRRPQVRYGWACSFLAAMVLLPLATWFRTPATPIPGMAELGSFAVEAVRESAGLRDRLAWTPTPALRQALALLWCLGAALMGLRLTGGIVVLQRVYLRRSGAAPREWQLRLTELARGAGLGRSIRLRLSEGLDTPLVLGWLRPVVLLPASALLALEPRVLEAVLAHELAHIRRHDYLVNLLQSLAEALLFFHPAAWWLSRQIRELREHCCDDDAVALTGSPTRLAEGLSRLALLRRTPAFAPEPALAAAKGPLMTRIHRLLDPKAATAPSLTVLCLALAGSLALAQAAPKNPPAAKPAKEAKAVSKASEAPAPGGVAEVDFSKVKVAQQPKAPAYPAEAKEKGIQGTVVVILVIDETGKPESVTAESGPEELRSTAVDYAKGWRFKPYQVKGKPAKARFKLTMPFRLK